MALRNQPYLPLYVQDFMTDEKLVECSASATGVYIRLMCIMHKSDPYGIILLKQKDKQTDDQIKNFTVKIAKQMPYSESVIYEALVELLDQRVLYIDGDMLCQKRMIKDDSLSTIRAEAGRKGGKNTTKKHFAQAKIEANTECVYEGEIETEGNDINDNICHLGLKEKDDFCLECKKKHLCNNPASEKFKYSHSVNSFEEYDQPRDEKIDRVYKDLNNMPKKNIDDIDDYDYLNDNQENVENDKM